MFACFDAIFLVRPFSQIDHLAAFATERAEAVAGIPYVFFTAVRAGDDGWFAHLQGTESQVERDILIVQRGLGRVVGFDETDVECIFIGADLGDAGECVYERDAQHLRHATALHLLEAAMERREVVYFSALAQKFEQDSDTVA